MQSYFQTGSCITGNGEGQHDTYGNEKHLETIQYTANLSPVSYTRQITSNNVHQQNISIEEVHEQIHITETKRSEPKQTHHHSDSVKTGSKSLTTDIYSVEIDQLSLANRNLSDQLQSVRHQLSDNLNRVRDFEERVKQIPKLQLELSVEKAENRDLHLKLRALQNALERREQHESKTKLESSTITETMTTTTTSGEQVVRKPFNTHHVCATSLESINIRFPNSSSPNESQKSHPSTNNNQPSTQNVGCMTNKTLQRDVGVNTDVVTVPVVIPSRTMGINTNISATNPFEETQKKLISKSFGVQCDHESRTISKSVATITDRELSPPRPVEKRSVAVLAIPDVTDSSCLARPDIRSIGVDNIYEKVRTRSFGTNPIKHLETTASDLPIDSPISLKFLDTPKSNINSVTSLHETSMKLLDIPKEFRSIGIQQSPDVQDKFSQCAEKLGPPSLPSPKVQTHTESTDTSDLTLQIHRGMNTDALAPKKHRLTNTNHILTENKSTNTSVEKKTTVSSETNTEQYEKFDETTKTESSENVSKLTLNEHQCHNCLARIEIKQRTIIKNPNKIERVPGNIGTTTSSTTTAAEKTASETHNEELLSSVQSSDLHSRIPRPTALISPRSEKKFTRQNTYTIPSSPTSSSQLAAFHYADVTVSQCPAEAYLT